MMIYPVRQNFYSTLLEQGVAQVKTPSAQGFPMVSHSCAAAHTARVWPAVGCGGTRHVHPISPKDFPGGNTRGLASLQVLRNVGCCSIGSEAKRVTKNKPASCKLGSLCCGCCSSLLPSSQGTALQRDKGPLG